MQPFSPHNRFFSSLDQLQLRLSSDQQQNQNPSKRPKQELSADPSLFSSSPLYILDPEPHSQNAPATSSGPPLDFLSCSQPQEPVEEEEEEDEEEGEDVDALMGLLGLSIGSSSFSPCSCECSESGFYKDVVGVKGPKCEKETKRLDGWIEKYYREKTEPARLAHLLIGKAVAMSERGGGLDGVEFPSTVGEFLERDPVA